MTCLLTSLFSVSFFFNSIDNRTNTVVAIKIIDLEEAEDEIEDIQQEITVLSQCDSAFVTKYHGSYLKVFAVQADILIYFSHMSSHIKIVHEVLLLFYTIILLFFLNLNFICTPGPRANNIHSFIDLRQKVFHLDNSN